MAYQNLYDFLVTVSKHAALRGYGSNKAAPRLRS
jgi:hypothetical protein